MYIASSLRACYPAIFHGDTKRSHILPAHVFNVCSGSCRVPGVQDVHHACGGVHIAAQDISTKLTEEGEGG